MRLAGTLEEADGQDDAEFLRQRREARDECVSLQQSRQAKILRALRLAEVGRLEKLLQQDNIRAAAGRLPNQSLGPICIGAGVINAGNWVTAKVTVRSIAAF